MENPKKGKTFLIGIGKKRPAKRTIVQGEEIS